MDEAYRDNPAIFPPDEIIAKCEPGIYVGRGGHQVRDEAWTRIQAALAAKPPGFRGQARIVESWKDNPRAFWTLASPGTFWLLLFFIVPLGIIWVMSFGEKTSITDIAITGTLANYLRAFDPVYLQIIWKSLWISGLATALCLLVAYPVAFGICFAPNAGKPLLLLLVILPFWINLLIRTYALIAVFRTNGFVNYGLEFLHDLLASPTLSAAFEPLQLLYNDFAVIAGLVYVYMPFMVLPLYATIERLDRSFLEASLDLGASQSRTFLSVTLPLTMPGSDLGRHLGLHPLPRLLPHPRSPGRRQCGDDRQCDRATVQGRQ